MRHLLIALLLCSCGGTFEPGKGEAESPATYKAMCRHLQSLGCPEGDAVYNDDLPGPVDVPNQSCEDFHRGLSEDGIPVNAKCVRLAPTCDEVEAYRQKDPSECG